jgi:hypothetical protein
MNDYAIQGLVQIILLGIVVLVPVTGITVRYMLRPFLDAGARKRDYLELKQENSVMEKRVALLEYQLETVERSLHRMVEAQEFDQALRPGPSAPLLDKAPRHA